MIILDRTPRFDTQTEDPFGLKPKLATFGNELCREILKNNIHKDKIEVGIHKISCNADNYGYENDGHVDGIHMYGPRGSEGYTKSLMAILSEKLKIQPGGINFPPARRIVK